MSLSSGPRCERCPRADSSVLRGLASSCACRMARRPTRSEAFAFEEIPTDHAHEDYLWGNGAFAAALVLTRAYLGASDGFEGEIGDLPAFTYMEHGEPTLKPCAEFCMTERAAAEALARGIMPLVSYQNRNAVRLIRLQSIGATAIG